MISRSRRRGRRPLPDEDVGTESASEARHWMVIYSERVGLWEERLAAARAADADAAAIERMAQEVAALRERRQFWLNRHWELGGLDFDRTRYTVSHVGGSVRLTERESQLLDFLISHPHRFFRTSVLVGRAWPDSRLSEEQLRTYVVRLRKKLARVGAPCRIESRAREGYRLTFVTASGKAAG